MKQLLSPGAVDISGGTFAKPKDQFAASLPAVVIERSQKRFSLTLAAEQSITISIAGDFVFLERARTNSTGALWGNVTPALTFKPDNSQIQTPITEGVLQRFPTAFSQFEIKNNSTSDAAKLILWVGFGDFAPAYANRPPAMFSHFATLQAPNGAAYAANQAIGSALFDFNVFPDAYSHLRIVRARLSYDLASVALASFRAYVLNDDTALAPADRAQLVITSANWNSLQGVIEFAPFINDGVSAFSFCEISGINLPITKAIAGAFPERIRIALVALGAWNPAAITNYRIDLTVSA